MPLQLLHVPQNNNRLLVSFCLSYLLPVFDDDDALDKAIEQLFGLTSGRVRGLLIQALEAYTPQVFPDYLFTLINNKLRPRLVTFILNNSNDFLPFYDSKHEFEATVAMIRQADGFVIDGLDVKALSMMTNRSLLLDDDRGIVIQQESNRSFETKESMDALHRTQLFSQDTIHISLKNGFPHYYLNSDELSPTLLQNLFPFGVVQGNAQSVTVDEVDIKKAYFRRELKAMFSDLQLHLFFLSQAAPQRTYAANFNPANDQLLMRFDTRNELSQVRNDVIQVKLIDERQIGNMRSWAGSLGISSVVGGAGFVATGSLAIGGVSILTGEVLAVSASIALLPVSLPVAVATFISIMGFSYVGKDFAVKYEKVLLQVNELLSQGNYDSAAVLLGEEFNRWSSTKAARWLFLTPQHYTLAHFFRAACADESNQKQQAYSHYQQACDAAIKSNSLVILLLSKLQQLKLLQSEAFSEYPNREKEIKMTLLELTQRFPEGFAALYKDIHDSMTVLSRRLTKPLRLEEDDLNRINRFLMADSFANVQYFDNGNGQFIGLLGVFFQAALLTYAAEINQPCIQERTKSSLIKMMGIEPFNQYVLNTLASKKFIQCVALLQAFKQAHPERLGDNTNNLVLSDIISCMEQFIVKFYNLSTVYETPIFNDFSDMKQKLFIKDATISQILQVANASIDFLTRLNRDFGLSYDSIDAWLDELLSTQSPLNSLVSPTTGDTMLHALAYVPAEYGNRAERLQVAAKRLVHLRYERNHRGEMVEYLLNTNDPFQLKAIFKTTNYVKLGNELDEVETFLNQIDANPDIDGHFLLLDGPPGTGKTSAVLNHLKNLGYPIREWVRGQKDDKSKNGIIARACEFFKQAKKETCDPGSRSQLQVLFIDEIHGIIPETEGVAQEGYYSTEADVTAFLTEISALKGHRVVLIGATNYPELLPPPILSRAGVNRIYFPLPNVQQRKHLLEHLFVGKKIEPKSIEKLATVAVGYSPRQLTSFVESIKELVVTDDIMQTSFNRYAKTLKKDFKKEFDCAEIFMPCFEQEGDSKTIFSSNVALQEQMYRLQHDTPEDPKKHTLLFGPPGGGKTTAVRVFAQTAGCILIVIEASEHISKDTLNKVFVRAKQLGRVVIFFDEIDRIAYTNSRHTAFLQTEMDGITTNHITIIGATNYQNRLEPAILNRFSKKIFLPQLSATELNAPIRQSLLAGIQSSQYTFYFDQALATEMLNGATRLGAESEGLSLRDVNAALCYLLGDLNRERPKVYFGITYLRFQDVCFSFYLMKIQERLVPAPAVDFPTSTQYIRNNKSSFFPQAIPEGSIPASQVIINMN